jgi:cytochrome c
MKRPLPNSILLLGLLAYAAACKPNQTQTVFPGADPHRGRDAIVQYGCGACHTIPGVTGARALVGQPLDTIANRNFIGGVLPNTPQNMVRWLQDPPAVDHQTAMPKLKLNSQEARDIASYLYTLK